MNDGVDKWRALQAFWESFGVPAYEQMSVPRDAELPYITYNGVVGALDERILMSISIWCRDMSWEWISKKADEIAERIGYSYAITTVDGGYLWITRGTPFAQRMSDEDPTIKRIYINVVAEYLTAF